MRIESCYVENFGKLHQVSLEFSENLTMMMKENGWGKSTLAAFIEAMFYGLSANNRGKLVDNMRKRYQPWQSGIYGGSLVFVTHSGRFRVQRSFGTRPKEDTYQVIDAGTGLPCPDFSEYLGEELFGMDRVTWRFTMYFKQKDLRLQKTDAMYTLLGKDEQEGEQTEGFERAIGRLEDAMRTYKKTGGRGLIDELAMKREELLHAMAQADSEIPDVLACRQMEEGRRQFGEWSPQMAAREQELLEEGIFQCEQLNEQEKEIALKQAQYDVIADLEVKTPESEEVQKPEGSYGWLWLAAGCFLGSIVLGIMVSPFGFAVALLGLICLWMNTKRERAMQQKYQQDVRQAKKKRQEAFLLAKEARAEELSHRAKVIATMKEENQRLEADIRGQLARYHMEESHNLMTTFVMLKEALLSYGQMACHQEEEREERKAQLTAQLSRVEAQLAEAKERYEELELTKELLLEAKKRYAGRYLEKARRRFAFYQEQVFGEAKAEITTELTISVVEDGFVREVDYYSEGTKDLLVLCARLALVDAMFEGEVPFLLLDDAFNELDEKHQQAAMRVLHAVAAERQVVCFSCRNIAKQ